MKKETPMMAQYKALKAQYPGAILFFRLGDFYEMFYEDAEIASKELGIVLTGRDAGEGERAPMCGVPYHTVDEYLEKLVSKGYRVAICDQMEDPAQAKGLVRREVTRLVTPGTFWEGAPEKGSVRLVSVVKMGSEVGLACCDLGTGDVTVASLAADSKKGRTTPGVPDASSFVDEIEKLSPKECLVPESQKESPEARALAAILPQAGLSFYPDEAFRPERAQEECERRYGTGVREEPWFSQPAVLAALGGLLKYLSETQKIELRHLKEPRWLEDDEYVEMDEFTRRNLEISRRLLGGTEGTLLWVLDECATPMGSRLLRSWLERPLANPVKIARRLEGVQELVDDAAMRMLVRKALEQVKDIERILARVSYGSANARDLVALRKSLEAAPDVKNALAKARSAVLADLRETIDPVTDLVSELSRALVDDPPATLTEGGLIRPGYSKSVDELRDLASGGKQWVLEFEARERERTGIKSLKVGYNRVFGYYIEVTRSNLGQVPPDYVRKQTLAGAERFTTPELREKEAAILGAESQLFKEEYSIFLSIRDKCLEACRRIQNTARALAEIDVLATYAHVAARNGYVRPVLSEDGTIDIKAGRHPVLEKTLGPGQFVPNDLLLNDNRRVLVITGPNMGGKSTFCRQAALLVLMAQAGSFVPAESAVISPVDRIFARVGAYDDLVMGQSTFMVEMSQVSRILARATRRSLIVLDEIGRGTSTFDGLAVAWAVIEYILNSRTCGAKALVATHYRELTLLEELYRGVKNVSVLVKRQGNELTFLHRIVPGPASGSFGVEVARMAGLPESVVARAREILSGLGREARRASGSGQSILGAWALRDAALLPESNAAPTQTLPFEASKTPPAPDPLAEEVIRDLKELDPLNMTPLQALEKLVELTKKVKGG
ncbi:MAG: DNA mismatch repair protein MutS [Firmicutes bacterium]|nr:DNA mismatch repair protein MutS [Candidatus Fermentithermobacillaceae bacterium]